MIVRPLQGRSPRLLGSTEEERCFGGEKDSKLRYASRYEVKVFGAWLPLAQLLTCDFSIPRKEILVQYALMGSRPLPKLVDSRHQLNRWNRSTRRNTGCAVAVHSKQRLGRHARIA